MDAALGLMARVFVVLFFAGVLGSMIVVIISFVEDLELLVDIDDDATGEAAIVTPR